jgi:hypothetical protein
MGEVSREALIRAVPLTALIALATCTTLSIQIHIGKSATLN